MSSSSSRLNLETCRIPLEEIIRATKNFSPETQVGDGGFGMVYRGQLSKQWENRSVAIKRLHPNGYQGNTEFYNELEMVKTFKHPNIIPFIGYCDDANEKIVVYEYATNISLDHHLQNPYKRRCLTWTQRLKICLGAARGLKYLHSGVGEHRRVIHRDMKSANILLDDNLEAKICDFGLSRFSPRNQQDTGVCTRASGTKFYIDPVYNERGRLTKESDIYSFGVVMFEMSTGTMAYDARRFEEAHEQYLIGIVRSTYEEHENVTGLDKLMDPAIRGRMDVSSFRKFNEIAYKCIDLDIKKRPTMDRIIEGIEEAVSLQLSFCTMKNPKFQLENFLDAFYIPDHILDSNKEVNVPLVGPTCPTIVFINSKSGGQLGNDLLVIYRSFLNENQVFDLVEEAPDRVLRKLYLNITTLKLNGDTFATMIEKRLRIIVAGGDGTAGWLLGVVSDLKLSHPPPIATMPLGTENNLPFAFGWGKKNPGTDRESVLNFLEQVMNGKQMQIDSWHILMRMKSAPKVGSSDPIAPLELPHSLHAFSRVSDTDELNVSGYDTFHGGFCDYFSMGMDAQLSYASHCERKLHPENLKNQLTNQIASPQGWFATSRFFPSSKNIAQLMKVKVMQRHGDWKDLKIHHNIRSILCLNLPCFSGGQNPWGTPNQNKSRDRDLTPPYVDDGILEIVGFKDAWQGVPLLAPKGHVIRLSQTHRVRFEFHKGAADCTYMSMDGEPWKQPLPVEEDDTVVVEISSLGKVKMLATQNCISKSVKDPSTPLSNEQEADYDGENEDGSSSGEKFRKFGAADTFKIPEDVDISRLS